MPNAITGRLLAHDQLEVRLMLGGIGRSSVTLTYEIVNATTRSPAEGHDQRDADPATRQVIPVPEATRTLRAWKAVDL
jgi:acyl-CoA thioesterase FadM